MRVLALDIGEKRVGVAISDAEGSVALPLDILDARALSGDVREIARLVDEHEVQLVLLGLPLSLAGDEGPQAQRVREAGERLARFLRVPIEYADERLSSAQAARAARELGRDSRDRRGRIDAAAAAVFLQTWLDGRGREETR